MVYILKNWGFHLHRLEVTSKFVRIFPYPNIETDGTREIYETKKNQKNNEFIFYVIDKSLIKKPQRRLT